MSAYPLHGHDDDVVGTAPLAGLFPGSKFEQPRKTISNTQCQYQILSVTRAWSARAGGLRAAGRARTRPPSPTRLARAPPPARAASAVGGLRSRATHGTRPDELDPSKGKDRKQRKLESHPGRLMLRPVVGRGSCRNSGPGGVWRRSTVQSRLSRAIGNPDRVSRPCSWPAWAARTAWRAARHRAPPRGPGVLARVSPRR